ncbi:hypothetical protein E4582_08895 [Luteimonas yindakuii]|uniref:Uncharacterized protein n=1 Tax=Luteimonas yindakuii TaxID=2565782 RepID=A0A4Z1R5D9_9GAMM|nr:hypothetical protein E4582_08895 [Luteimonas yindakuii]
MAEDPPTLAQPALPPDVDVSVQDPLPILRPIEPVPALTVASAPTAPPPPAGRAGLVALLRSGALRPASGRDLSHWKTRHAANNPRGVGKRFDEWARGMPAYVVVGDVQIPEGLAGADAVIFILGEKAPFPAGNPGHSAILDPVSGSCMGMICGMLMQD